MLKNRKGQVVTGGALVVAYLTAIIITNGVISNARTGKLKRDGKVIWCQMLNKGHDHCHAQHPWK
jgi:hypothetical protein